MRGRAPRLGGGLLLAALVAFTASCSKRRRHFFPNVSGAVAQAQSLAAGRRVAVPAFDLIPTGNVSSQHLAGLTGERRDL